jgi:Family of unknown function (DUF6370)
MKRFCAVMALAFTLFSLASFTAVTADEKEKGKAKEGKAKDGKEEKLVGKITCAKCDLGTADKCKTVVKVGEKVYEFDKDAEKKYHGDICTEAKEGTVVGVVKKDGDKLIVTVKSLEYKK